MEKKILIIEDDEYIANLESDYLEINGYTSTVIKDGKIGLEAALSGEFELIILDLMLPGADGFDVCKKIREKTDVPIIMVTAKKDEFDKVKGFGLGIDDYVVKPFNPSELVARVSAHIARYKRLTEKAASVPEDNLTIGELTINKSSRRVFISDKEITFTHKEFDLLAYLASHPNIVFSKDSLFDKIWGLDAIGETSTVTVHINRIREKIEDDSANPKYIETVWGVGYRFKVD